MVKRDLARHRRGRGRRWYWVLLLALLVPLVIVYRYFMHTGGWRADLALDNLDCSQAAICRYHPNMNTVDGLAVARYQLSINALGFRGPDLPIQREDPATLRIEVFGDSMVFGIGVDNGETLPVALQRTLQQRLGSRRKVEVMNFGLPANFLLSNLRAYEAFGRRYDPDILIFANPRTQIHDINWRAQQIKSSFLLSTLMKTGSGRWLVNTYQQEAPEWPWSSRSYLRDAWQTVAADQRQRDMKVYFFEFFSQIPPDWRGWIDDAVTAMKKGIFPADLKFAQISSGMMIDDYRKSSWAIPGDGHPTPEGHEHFAGLIADAILADLASNPATPGATKSPPQR